MNKYLTHETIKEDTHTQKKENGNGNVNIFRSIRHNKNEPNICWKMNDLYTTVEIRSVLFQSQIYQPTNLSSLKNDVIQNNIPSSLSYLHTAFINKHLLSVKLLFKFANSVLFILLWL